MCISEYYGCIHNTLFRMFTSAVRSTTILRSFESSVHCQMPYTFLLDRNWRGKFYGIRNSSRMNRHHLSAEFSTGRTNIRTFDRTTQIQADMKEVAIRMLLPDYHMHFKRSDSLRDTLSTYIYRDGPALFRDEKYLTWIILYNSSVQKKRLFPAYTP